MSASVHPRTPPRESIAGQQTRGRGGGVPQTDPAWNREQPTDRDVPQLRGNTVPSLPTGPGCSSPVVLLGHLQHFLQLNLLGEAATKKQLRTDVSFFSSRGKNSQRQMFDSLMANEKHPHFIRLERERKPCEVCSPIFALILTYIRS